MSVNVTVSLLCITAGVLAHTHKGNNCIYQWIFSIILVYYMSATLGTCDCRLYAVIRITLEPLMKLAWWIYRVNIPNIPKKTSQNLRNYNTSWGKISFGTFVDQHVLLLTYKFQWPH